MTLRNDTGPSADDFTHSVDALRLEADRFSEVTADNAGDARDLIARTQALGKKVEGARKEAKQPHMDAAKAVDAEFKPLKEALDDLVAAIKRPLQAYLVAEEKRRQAEAEAARKAAEEAAAFAEDASADDDAELAAKAAEFAKRRQEKAEQATALAENRTKVESKAGLSRAASLRTYRYAEITDALAAAAHYANHPDVLDAIQKVANAEIRAAKGAPVTIPGVTVREEQRIA